MTVEKLLEKRWEVINDYPDTPYTIGEIYEGDEFFNGSAQTRCAYENYPAIFKPLAWYERRELSEMPEYVKATPLMSLNIVKAEEWSEDLRYFQYRDNITGKLKEGYVGHCLPATQTEYTSYLNQK